MHYLMPNSDFSGVHIAAWGGWVMAVYNAGLGNVMVAQFYYAGVSAGGVHLLWQI